MALDDNERDESSGAVVCTLPSQLKDAIVDDTIIHVNVQVTGEQVK